MIFELSRNKEFSMGPNLQNKAKFTQKFKNG